jgi:hypothetical protein
MRLRLETRAEWEREVLHVPMHPRTLTRSHPRNCRVAAAFIRERRAMVQ